MKSLVRAILFFRALLFQCLLHLELLSIPLLLLVVCSLKIDVDVCLSASFFHCLQVNFVCRCRSLGVFSLSLSHTQTGEGIEKKQLGTEVLEDLKKKAIKMSERYE